MDPDAREEIEDSLTHAIPRTPLPQYIDDAVFLEVKGLLAQHPDKRIKAWSEKPRLYTLLRMLDYHDEDPVFQKLDSEQVGDFWLPLSSATLNQLSSALGLSPQEWRRAQLHVCSKSELMSEEKLLSHVNTHRHIQHGNSHFEELEQMGQGGSAEVARVRHKLSGKQFACKRIRRGVEVKAQRKQLIEFEQEVGVLQRISHHHLVSFVASFTDLTSFSLILNPVAKDVLKSVLERQSREEPLSNFDLFTLRHAFGCLATALAYLHDQRIRHKDIKPGNILLSDGRVYLCDFGISRDWSKSEHSTTEGDVMKFTRRYCAPEVFGHESRNTKSDIWSLGCVFLEILSVIKGYPLEEFNKFLDQKSDEDLTRGLWAVHEAMNAWLVKLKTNDSADDIPLEWITPMLRLEAKDRLSTPELVSMIHKQSANLHHTGLFVGPCCSRSDSIAPIESPPLHEPAFGGLGIEGASMSPPKAVLSGLPHRNSSPTSIDRPKNAASNRHRSSRDRNHRDRSISPGTQSLGPRESSEAVPFAMDPFDGSPSAGGFAPKSLRHSSSQSDSHRSLSRFTPVPEYDASSAEFQRSPIPPPASFDIICACAARPNEKHIFNASYATLTPGDDGADVPFTLDPRTRTVETCTKCEIGEDKVQIYETLPRDPSASFSVTTMMWWVTRRLVVSYLWGNPEMRRCSSFWVPLADVQFMISGNDVTLRWSDCNQVRERRLPNYGQVYDWKYDPTNPNNSLTIKFMDTGEARQFVDTIRLPFDDGAIVSRRQRVSVTGNPEVNIYSVARPCARKYFVANLTTIASGLATSKLFIQWPEVDLDIRIQEAKMAPSYQMVVEIKNVATPTYHSDVRGEPAADDEKVAKFTRALQLKTSLVVTFPISLKHNLPVPPTDVVDLLRGLTGWTPRYFAIVAKVKSKNKRFGSKKYGRADIMLWEREVDDSSLGVKRRGAVVTFRLHEETDLLWMSGTITQSTDISFSAGLDAIITVTNKTRGKLLHVGKMVAIASENPRAPSHAHSRSTSDAHEDQSDLVLTFEDTRYRLEFAKIIEDFKTAAAATAPLTRIATSGSSNRRIRSLASDSQMSPPMR